MKLHLNFDEEDDIDDVFREPEEVEWLCPYCGAENIGYTYMHVPKCYSCEKSIPWERILIP